MIITSTVSARFANQDHLEEVHECRWLSEGRCPFAEGECPLGVSKDACAVAGFMGSKGCTPPGAAVVVGDVRISGAFAEVGGLPPTCPKCGNWFREEQCEHC